MAGSGQRVYLHIGAPKTGTTYLQEVLWSSREALRANGVLYPGGRHDAHFFATQDLRELKWHGHVDPAVVGAWDRIVDQVRAWPGASVISHEMLASAAPQHIERAMRSLRGIEVHIVLTTRDLARQVPAVWQEDIKNCGRLTYAEFTRSLQGLDDTVNPFFAKTFWSYQDLPTVLRNWGETLPPEQVHVVTVPRGAARDELWHRFTGIVGIDPVRCPATAEVKNPSMGVVETNLVRRVNETLVPEFDWPTYQNLVKNFLAVDVLAGRPGSVSLRLPAADRGWISQRAKEMVQAIRDAGYQVVGDLDDLVPTWRANEPEPRDPDSVSDSELLDAAVYALNDALRKVAEERAAAEADRRALMESLRLNPRLQWMLDRYRGARTKLRTHLDSR